MGSHQRIVTNKERCVGCLRCELICSLAHDGVFNLKKSRIVVEPREKINFTEDCISTCVLCSKYCPTGALIKRRKDIE